MKIHSTNENIVILKTESQYELAATFLRLQEYYESPKFSGQVFDIEQYMDWYAEEYGNFTYFTDWNGFNVPGGTVRNFYNKFLSNGLSRKETIMLAHLDPFIESEDKFYLIGVHTTDAYLQHELAHAFYYIDPAYKISMHTLTNKLPKTFISRVENKLESDGYHCNVIEDETQAYLATSSMTEIADMFSSEIPWDDVLQFQFVYEQRYEVYQNGEKKS